MRVSTESYTDTRTINRVKTKISIREKHVTDFRIASSTEEKENVFRFRYRSYIDENIISPISSELFSDSYDSNCNCYIFRLYLDNKMVSTVRLHVLSSETPVSPSYEVFSDLLDPLLDGGNVIIDPTRLATTAEAAAKYKMLPYLTLKAACMAIKLSLIHI